MLPCTAAAQTDYRNLDVGRPLLTEDAYPTAHYAFEFTAPLRLERGPREHRFELSPQLSWGAVRNGMVEVELPWVARTDRGEHLYLAGPRLGALYNFNSESPRLPALSLHADAALPGGAWSGAHTIGGVTAIATRSFGRWRVHLNLAGHVGSVTAAPIESPVDRWAAAIASDVTVWRQSLLLAAEARVNRPIGGVRSWRIGAGARWQFTPTLVLDAGVSRTHSPQRGTEVGLSFGLTQLFGFAALMPGGSR